LQSRGNVGPWSDLYALGGTLVKAITGEAPPRAMDRMRKDPHQPLAERVELRSQFTQGFLHGIDKSLEVEEDNRWQNAEEWLEALQRKAAEEKAQPIVNTSVNSLGMKFVSVKITGGPSAGQEVLFSIWETRVQDYHQYAAARSGVDGAWTRPGYPQGEDHPVVKVSWEDAVAFCEWLTGQERSAGRISATAKYRLPTDHEWSCAVGIGAREDVNVTPASKDDKIGGVYPWGTQWPPPMNAGNYGGSLKVDNYAYTSPVGSFAANGSGIYDLGGNVWEWCADWYDERQANRVVRGGSWYSDVELGLRSSSRPYGHPMFRDGTYGFRCVLVISGG
jgi:formylglycine-generating enzyme required for sulfatase activity